jgi:methyl-accepting chemotaxis protein
MVMRGKTFMRKRKSLQARAIFIVSLIVVILISTVTYLEYVNSKKLIMASMESSGKQTISIQAQKLSSWVKSRLSQVEVIANTQLVSGMNYEEIIPYFQREQKNYDGVYNTIGISDTTGKLLMQNNVTIDISSEDTFPRVMKGEKIISNPFQDKQNPKDLIISMECPVKNPKDNKVIGLVSGACLVTTVFKENTDFHIGKTDKVYLIGKDGTVLFRQDDNSNKEENFLKSSNKEFADLVKEAISKDNFTGEFKDNNETEKLFVSHVEGTDWYMLLEVPTKEYTSSLESLLYFIVIVSAVAMIVLIILLTILLQNFFNKLLKISLIAEEVAAGNLMSSLPESSDELGRINTTFNKMIDNLRNIIIKIKNVSEVVIESSDSYKKVSLEVVECGKDIKQSIENITSGAKHTANEVQNITRSINDMENKSKELVDISANIDQRISETNDKTLNGSKNLEETVKLLYKMKESVNISAEVINDLAEKSKNIANITTTISSISEQTNLLALNASIEAARAGENGKGFSVVAEEVRKLAEQSSESTQGISSEIQQIQEQVANAVAVMKDSIDYMGLSTSSIDNISSTFSGIEKEIENIKLMSLSISEIAKSLLVENKNINEAVSNTSAISEESVASTVCFEEMIDKQGTIFLNLKKASEDLDELSISLSKELSKFRIK